MLDKLNNRNNNEYLDNMVTPLNYITFFFLDDFDDIFFVNKKNERLQLVRNFGILRNFRRGSLDWI